MERKVLISEEGQKTVTLTDPDRVKLQVAAVIGAVLGIVTYYVVGSRWLAVLLCALIGAVHGPVTCYVVGGYSPPWSVEQLDACFVVTGSGPAAALPCDYRLATTSTAQGVR